MRSQPSRPPSPRQIHAVHVALRDARDLPGAAGPQVGDQCPVGALVDLPIRSIVREYRPCYGEWDGIVLEITEDQAIRDIDMTHDIATQLRTIGSRSPSTISAAARRPFRAAQDMPFAELKLDRSFVADCGNDEVNAALCKTAVDLAHRFGSLAVAEGIEKAADLVAVTRTGCDIAQGFIFAHAMPRISSSHVFAPTAPPNPALQCRGGAGAHDRRDLRSAGNKHANVCKVLPSGVSAVSSKPAARTISSSSDTA